MGDDEPKVEPPQVGGIEGSVVVRCPLSRAHFGLKKPACHEDLTQLRTANRTQRRAISMLSYVFTRPLLALGPTRWSFEVSSAANLCDEELGASAARGVAS